MKLTLLQWNILYTEDPANIAKTIAKLDPDITCLQEVARHLDPPSDAAEVIGEALQRESYHEVSHTWEGKGDIGNAIFSRWPITHRTVDFIRQPSEGRTYIEAVIAPPGKPVTVGTTHMSFTPGFTTQDPAERKNLLKNIKSHRYVLTGDFNSLPESRLVQDLEKRLLHAGPPYEAPTWTTKPFDYMGMTEDKLRWRLDYVFVSRDIKVTGARIIDTPYSDHLPVWVELEL